MLKDISNNDFSIFFLRIYFSMCGVKLENDPLRHLNHSLLIVILSLFITIQHLFMLYYLDNANVKIIVFNNLIHIFNYFTTWVLLQREKDTLKVILETVRQGIHHYPPFMEPYLVPHLRKSTLLQVLFYAANVCFLLLLLVPMIHKLLEGEKPPNSSNLIYPASYPWQINSHTSYFLTYFIQLTGAIVTAGYMPSNITFLVYFVLVVRDQTTLLISVTKNVAEKYKKSTAVIQQGGYRLRHQDPEYDIQLTNTIIECVKHHHSIRRFIDYFIEVFEWIFVLILAYSTVVFTFNCYLLLSNDYYSPTFTQTIIELLLVFPYLFMFCYIGEVFKDTNYMFRETIYDINWYEKPVKLQKSMLLILTSTTKDITLGFRKNLVASYMLFSSILKASYTFTNILLNTTRN